MRPVALLLCMLSLYAVFHAAFLVPASDWQQRMTNALELLALAGGISLIGGVIFYKSTPSSGQERFTAMLPVRVFLWATGAMILLFIACWYLESYGIFYRDIHPLR